MTGPLVVFAVDPGATAGLVAFEEHNLQPWVMRVQGRPMDVVQMVDQGLKVGSALPRQRVVVCERFTLTSVKHTRQYDALEMIGALRYVAHLYGAAFELQSRADKSRVSNLVLRAHGLYRGDEPHMMDAARHCLLAIVRHRPDGSVTRQLARIR